jgi:hypothetical protein
MVHADETAPANEIERNEASGGKIREPVDIVRPRKYAK